MSLNQVEIHSTSNQIESSRLHELGLFQNDKNPRQFVLRHNNMYHGNVTENSSLNNVIVFSQNFSPKKKSPQDYKYTLYTKFYV